MRHSWGAPHSLQTHKPLHRKSEVMREAREVRRAPIQTAQSDLNHVRHAQGLVACGNPVCLLPLGLLHTNWNCCPLHLLASTGRISNLAI